MENSKLGLIAAKRQHFISRLQGVEPGISSPPGNATLPKAEPFLAVIAGVLRHAVIAAIKAFSFVFVRNCQLESENDY